MNSRAIIQAYFEMPFASPAEIAKHFKTDAGAVEKAWTKRGLPFRALPSHEPRYVSFARTKKRGRK